MLGWGKGQRRRKDTSQCLPCHTAPANCLAKVEGTKASFWWDFSLLPYPKPVLREQTNPGCETSLLSSCHESLMLSWDLFAAWRARDLPGEAGSCPCLQCSLGMDGALPQDRHKTPQRLFWHLQPLTLPPCWKEGSSACSWRALVLGKWEHSPADQR